jgi:hypothetical protein
MPRTRRMTVIGTGFFIVGLFLTLTGACPVGAGAAPASHSPGGSARKAIRPRSSRGKTRRSCNAAAHVQSGGKKRSRHGRHRARTVKSCTHRRPPSRRGRTGPAVGAPAPAAASTPPRPVDGLAGLAGPLQPPVTLEAPAAEAPPGEASPPSGESPQEAAPGESAPPTEPSRFFSASSFWNEPLPAGASLDPSSQELVEALDTEVARELSAGKGPWINTTSDSVPVYTVEAEQPTVPVQLEYDLEPALAASWSEVPIAATAKPAAGSDKTLVVWQPSTGRMWEFWRLVRRAGGWSASWGGSIQDAYADSGVYGPEAWPGAKPWWGASATSLAIAGGLMTFTDLEQGRIEHVLAMAIPNVRAGIYALPAQREDGKSSNPQSLPEGAHLRLDPSLDLSTLHLPPLTLMIAEAAQRYGIIVRDQASNIAFFGQDPTPTGSNPYTGPRGYFGGKYPSQLLSSFPWSHLQVLSMSLRER